MSTKKRFYIEPGIYDPDPIADEEEFCFIRDSTTSKRIHQASYRITDEVNYLEELCDLLNKGHEATDGLQDASDEALIGELRRRIEQANKAELDNWIYVTYDIHSDAVLTEPEATEAER